MHFKLSYFYFNLYLCLQMACCAAQLLGSAGKHLAAQAGAPQIKLPVLISLYLCVFYFVQLVLYLSDKQLLGYENQIVFQCWWSVYNLCPRCSQLESFISNDITHDTSMLLTIGDQCTTCALVVHPCNSWFKLSSTAWLSLSGTKLGILCHIIKLTITRPPDWLKVTLPKMGTCAAWKRCLSSLRTVPACLCAFLPACLHTRGGGVEAGKQSYNMQEADECCLPIYLPLYWMLPCLIAHSCCPVLKHCLHIGNMSRDARFSKFVLVTYCLVLWNHNLCC